MSAKGYIGGGLAALALYSLLRLGVGMPGPGRLFNGYKVAVPAIVEKYSDTEAEQSNIPEPPQKGIPPAGVTPPATSTSGNGNNKNPITARRYGVCNGENEVHVPVLPVNQTLRELYKNNGIDLKLVLSGNEQMETVGADGWRLYDTSVVNSRKKRRGGALQRALKYFFDVPETRFPTEIKSTIDPYMQSEVNMDEINMESATVSRKVGEYAETMGKAGMIRTGDCIENEPTGTKQKLNGNGVRLP